MDKKFFTNIGIAPRFFESRIKDRLYGKPEDFIVEEIFRKKTMKIVLASGSPRRKELLQKLFPEFIIDPANADEISELNGKRIEDVVQQNALMKAQAIQTKHPDSLIIGADTVVYFENRLIGKPKNTLDAQQMLVHFSGKWHSVFTGIALINTRTHQQTINFEESKVKFKTLTPQQIEEYIATGEPNDMAGAYKSQGKGACLIEKIEGSRTNIIGLPMEKLIQELEKIGITTRKQVSFPSSEKKPF